MIVVMVTFRLAAPVTLDEMTSVFRSTAPKYLNLPGLLRKNYYLSVDGLRAGGIYVWESKARAEAFYDEQWKATVAAKYGAAPEIVYMDSPVMVDNANGTIVGG